jgi:hypothetical protein
MKSVLLLTFLVLSLAAIDKTASSLGRNERHEGHDHTHGHGGSCSHAHHHDGEHGHSGEGAHEHVHKHVHDHSAHHHHHHDHEDDDHDDHDGHSHSHGHSAHSDQPVVCVLKLDDAGKSLVRLLSGKRLGYRVHTVLGRDLELENMDGLVTSFDSVADAIRGCRVVLSTFTPAEEEKLTVSLRSTQIWISISTSVPKADHSAIAKVAASWGSQFLHIVMPNPVSTFGTPANRIVEIAGSIKSRSLHDLVSSIGQLAPDRDEL